MDSKKFKIPPSEFEVPSPPEVLMALDPRSGCPPEIIPYLVRVKDMYDKIEFMGQLKGAFYTSVIFVVVYCLTR